MKHDRFQNHIAESTLTLPVCAVLATFLWWWPSRVFDMKHVVGWLVCALTAYLLMEINNENQLIRLRTRLVSSVWLVSLGCMAFLHPIGKGGLCALCLVASYFVLFRCYQQRDCLRDVFHCFLLLGVGSLIYLPFAFLVLAYFWYLAIFLRAMDWHIFWAGIIGLLFPYWMWFCWSFLQQDFTVLLSHLQFHPEWSLPSFTQSVLQLSLSQKFSWVLVTILVVIGALHFLRTRYTDKIRVRMLFYILACQVFLLEACFVVFPDDFDVLMPLLVLSGCPFVAHYFALTGSWFTNILFCLSILAFGALATMPFWITLMNINFN